MRVTLLLLFLSLAACSGVPTTGTPDIATFYGRSVVGEATHEGAIALVVHGRPAVNLSEAEAGRLIADQVQLPGWFPPTRLAPAAGGETYRVVLIFNPASIADAANHPCGPLDDLASRDDGGGLLVIGAFCSGERPASSNRGSVSDGTPLTREAVVPLVRQLVVSLFPPENPVLRDDRRRPFSGGLLFGG